MPVKIKKVLIIGSGANEISHETELDSATFEVAVALKQLNVEVILIENNPFSFALENKRSIDHACILPVTIENVLNVIDEYQPDAILPNLGGLQSIRMTQELIESGLFNEHEIQLLGVPEASIRQINNPVLLNQTMRQMQVPIITNEAARNFDEAITITEDTGFPVIIKPVSPRSNSSRATVHDRQELAEALTTALQQSRVGQAMVQQSIAGYKEVEMVVLRDHSGTMMHIATVENFDPIGIHAGDSIGFTPAQTLLDREFQTLRDTAFAITRKLRIVGVNHIQFALNPQTSSYYVIKNSPYFDRITSFAARATGYPLALVCANVFAGKNLSQIKIPNLSEPEAALIEPVMDHVAARLPVWPFDVIPEADQPLGTQMRSTGATMGVGRSIEEALMKAIRAAHFHRSSFTISQQAQLSDDQLIQQIIHPKANRILILFEALRRGYSIDELAELTKIDAFYLYKLRNLQDIEQQLAENPTNIDLLRRAKFYGLSDRTIGDLWGIPEHEVTTLQDENDIKPTYKEIEPSAGEFDQHTNYFYSGYEYENESHQTNHEKALVVGTGGFRLGSAGSADYQSAAILQELKRQGTETIFINNNPSAVSMSPLLVDKLYIEPLETPDIKHVYEIDQPDLIYVPSIRKRLFKELDNLGLPVRYLPQNQPALPHMANGPELAFNAIYDGDQIIPLGFSNQLIQEQQTEFAEPTASEYPIQLDDQTQVEATHESFKQIKNLNDPGIYQVLFVQTNRLHLEQTRLLPPAEIAFFSKVLGVNLTAIETRMLTRGLAPETIETINESTKKAWHNEKVAVFAASFPFQALRLENQAIQTASVIGAEIAFGDNYEDAIQQLDKFDLTGTEWEKRRLDFEH